MKKDLCHQCKKEIQGQTADGNYNVCVRPECPNYGLVQIGQKHLKKFIKTQSPTSKFAIPICITCGVPVDIGAHLHPSFN